MIEIHNLLNIVCTEAFEDGGIPEVPDHVRDIAQPNYWAPRRDARSLQVEESLRTPQNLPTFQYNVEFVVDEDGKGYWYD
jgi:hypothetical protein